MPTYQDLKFAVSDALCVALEPVSSDFILASCPRFADGMFVTVELLLLSCLLGFVIALLAASARVSASWWLAWPALAYTYVFRGTPLLVQLWVVYFGVGGAGEAVLGPVLWAFLGDAWWVGLMVLTLNTGAYVAELLRGALATLPPGQREAALAHGMSEGQALRRILLPQALRTAWPAYGNEVILLMKASALVSTITVMDLMGQTRTIFSRSYDLEVYAVAALLYLALAGVITLLFAGVERRWRTG